MTKKSGPTKNFEDQFKELESIVEELESGEVNLDTGLKKFERGLELAQDLKKQIAEVENKVEVIKKKFANTTETETPDEKDDTLNF
ncbi:MAG: exodeoxyribonuclease VII small subunit [bacterium]|nr:exodeoxyribonuclease VII small subunit [bacterium]